MTTKADTETLTNELARKADSREVEEALALKAAKADVDAALDGKASIRALDDYARKVGAMNRPNTLNGLVNTLSDLVTALGGALT